MKKLFLSFILIGIFTAFSGNLSAQSTVREPLSAVNKHEEGLIVAYPNPARDYIIIKAKNSFLKIKSVTFYSILGMQVGEYAVNMNSAEVRLDRLRPGKYLMRYTMSDNTQQVTQIVKQ